MIGRTAYGSSAGSLMLVMIEEAGPSHQRNDLQVQRSSVILQETSPWAQHDLFSHWRGGRFFLRCCRFIVPLGPPRNFFVVGRPEWREAAAIVGATVAL